MTEARVASSNGSKICWKQFGAYEDHIGRGSAEKESNYNYFRDYDPAIGRYVESDPIGLDAALNTFAYVDGNPVSLLDALGLDANTVTYGEIRGWAINNQRDFRPPPGLEDAKASITGLAPATEQKHIARRPMELGPPHRRIRLRGRTS